MFYPIVKCNEQDKIHAVKDQETCECGFIYRSGKLKNKDLFKPIAFKDIKEINCRKCKAALRKRLQL